MFNKPDSLEEKLYQLVIARLDGDRINDRTYRGMMTGLVKKGIGGFIVFKAEGDEIRDFIRQLQDLAQIPLFMASDIERGVQQQFGHATAFPCQMAVAAAIDMDNPGDFAVLERGLKTVADEARYMGINMPLIPVMDVNQDPDNPIICTRAFSDNPDDVALFGTMYIKFFESCGLISCAKHFPGHGDTAVDSHIALPVISKNIVDLKRTDIAPFVKAVRAGVSSIMIGHLTVQAIDSKPASLSRKVITDLLRKELGFSGLVLTDALNMSALRDFGNVAVECVNAGADILLHPVDADETVKELVAAVKAGTVSEGVTDSALSRILQAKSKVKIGTLPEVDYTGHARIASMISEMSITLVKSRGGIFPLRDLDGIHAVFAGDDKLYGASAFKKYFHSSAAGETGDIKSDTAIFAIFTSVAAWKGSSGIAEKERDHIARLVSKSKRSIIISFGSPYVLRCFNDADVLIAAYEPSPDAQNAVIRCLKGEIDFRGHLPVTFK